MRRRNWASPTISRTELEARPSWRPVTGTHAPSLHRFMRTLAGLGILAEGEAQRFALTPLGEALKTGAPGAARSTLIAFGGPAFWRSWEEIVYSLETGKPAFEKVWGMPLFDYLGTASGGRLALQRGDGGLSRLRTADRRRGLRLLGHRDRRRRRRRHREHAGGAAVPSRPACGACSSTCRMSCAMHRRC